MSSDKKCVVESISPLPDNSDKCKFYVVKKRRYCKITTVKGLNYCGEHLWVLNKESQDDATTNKSKRRIFCPYDSAHTIFEKDLEKHRLRCNARPTHPPPWQILNINCTLPLPAEELEFQNQFIHGAHSFKALKQQPWITRVQLSELPAEELSALITKIKENHSRVVGEIGTKVLDHSVLEQRKKELGWLKHVIQQASLLGHMERLGLLRKDVCYVEFGAGTGELSYYIKSAVDAIDEKGEAAYLLIDRKKVRGKYDSSLATAPHLRLAIDIKDLHLSSIPFLQNPERPIIAVSKHLCGSATDLTLKSLTDHGTLVKGIIIALCCHQISRYPMYPNQRFLKEIGITEIDFARMCKISSWAVCGVRECDIGEDSESHGDLENDNGGENAHRHYSGLDHAERERIGYMVKDLLNIGRKVYLEQMGFQAELVYYVSSSTSLENCALIAVRP